MDLSYKEFFRRVTGFYPYDHQLQVATYLLNDREKTLLLEAPMGGGKTEAAVLPFLYSVKEGGVLGMPMIYVLPTRTLIRKQKERIERLVEKAGLKGEVDVVMEMGLEETTYYFKNAIVLTSLHSFFSQLAGVKILHGGGEHKYLHLSASPFASAYFVFDEVQMFQGDITYEMAVEAIFEMAYFKTYYNAPGAVLIMTATMPHKLHDSLSQRSEFVKVFDELDVQFRKIEGRGSVERGEVEVSYSGEISKPLDMVAGKRGALELIGEEVEKDNKVLIVSNTVDGAVEIYEYLSHHFKDLSKGGRIVLLHSRFTFKDREEKEAKLSGSEGPMIIVSTQVVESGMDLPGISLLITEACPLDALAQRIGRVARRKGERGKAIIYMNKNSLHTVYGVPKEKAAKLGRLLEKIKRLEPSEVGLGALGLSGEESAYSFLSDVLGADARNGDVVRKLREINYFLRERVAPFQKPVEESPLDDLMGYFIPKDLLASLPEGARLVDEKGTIVVDEGKLLEVLKKILISSPLSTSKSKDRKASELHLYYFYREDKSYNADENNAFYALVSPSRGWKEQLLSKLGLNVDEWNVISLDASYRLEEEYSYNPTTGAVKLKKPRKGGKR